MELSNERLLTWSEDGDLRIWHRSGQHLLRLQGHTDMVQGVRLLPDNRLLSWSGDATIRLWDSESGAALGVLEGHTDPCARDHDAR